MTKQREEFEKWMQDFHKKHSGEESNLYDYSMAVWQAAQADKLEFARKVAELVQVAENNLASFYSNQRAYIEDIPPNYTIDEIIAKVEQDND